MRKHIYASRREKLIDLWVGFVGFFVVDIAVIYLVQAISFSNPNVGLLLSGLLILVNVATPIVLAFTRPHMALGILVAFAIGLILTIVEGVLYTVSDFFSSSSNYAPPFGPVNIAFLVAGLVVVAIVAFFILRGVIRGTK